MMRFICAACGKTLDLQGKEARFCPFCGRAYAAAVMEGARADAVQAKYWQMTRAAYGSGETFPFFPERYLERFCCLRSSCS